VSDDDFDLSRFKSKKQDRRRVEEIVAATTVSERPPKKKARKPFKSKFIQVPMYWREALRGAPGTTFELALDVLAEKHKRDYLGGDVILSTEVTSLTKDSRHRAARDMVARRLVGLEVPSPRSAPRVTSFQLSS
jgi:hypothetical protein